MGIGIRTSLAVGIRRKLRHAALGAASVPRSGQDGFRRLRNYACSDPGCDWCRERHDARNELKHWFGFDDFRAEPADESGTPMQRSIIESAMAGENVLGILPTGAGKSLCYQIPALSRYDKTGALTVVISPLVALMQDQVSGLHKRGIESARNQRDAGPCPNAPTPLTRFGLETPAC